MSLRGPFLCCDQGHSENEANGEKKTKKPKKRKKPQKTVTARLASHAKTALLDTVGKICRNSKLFFFTGEEMQQTIA